MRCSFFIVACSTAAGLLACGGGNSAPTAQPTPVPTPTPPVPQIVAQGAGISIWAQHALWTYVTFPTAGTAAITVDYTFSDTSLGIWLAPGHWTYEVALVQQVPWVVRSFVNEKPRKVVQSVPAGEHTLVFDNVGTHDETVSYQVVFTALSSAAQAHGASNAAGTATPLAPHGPSAPQPSVP